ncbi:MAG: CPBP family intramembrane metalloprotease, partial [Planctomycetota bacterium]
MPHTPTPPNDPPHDARLDRATFLKMAALTEGTLLLIGLVIAFSTGLNISAEFDAGPQSVILGLLAAVPMLLFFALAMRTRWEPLRRIRELLFELLGHALARCTTWELFSMAMLAGLAEEFFFRGVLQPLLARWMDVWAAIGLTGLLFSLLHALTPAYAVVATLIGIYLGCLAQAGSCGGAPGLVAPIIA